jgi:hypothetical protein
MRSRAAKASVFCAALVASALGCGDDETKGGTPTGSEGGSTTSSGGGSGPGGSGSGGSEGGSGGGSSGSGGSGGTISAGCETYPEGALPFVVGGETHCFWLVSTSTPQIAANDACGLDGGYLVTVGSQAENDHVQTVAATSFPVWLGLRCDANPSGTCTGNKAAYAWMNGDPVSYDGWAAGEPSTPRGAAMHVTGEWFGYDSLNNPFPYICEGP